jgi:hypothetical protein
VSLPQRLGAALNAHLHLHCRVTDGVFSEAGGVLCFHTAHVEETDVQAVQRAIRGRVLRAAGVCQRAAESRGAAR